MRVGMVEVSFKGIDYWNMNNIPFILKKRPSGAILFVRMPERDKDYQEVKRLLEEKSNVRQTA
jgi:hypothetical protein